MAAVIEEAVAAAIVEAQTNLLVVVKDAVAPEGAGTDDVAVGQDVAPLGVHDEAGRLASDSRVGVKRARLAEADRHHVAHHRLDGALPLRRVGQHGRGASGQRQHALAIHGQPYRSFVAVRSGSSGTRDSSHGSHDSRGSGGRGPSRREG